jgi:hypothetical protein
VHRRDTFEPRFVALHLRLVRESRAQLAEDSGEVCVGRLGEAIVCPLAVAARGDESGATKVGKVTRNLWLIGPQHLDARTDTQFIVTQQMNQPQPGAVCEGFEECFEISLHLNPVTILCGRQFSAYFTQRSKESQAAKLSPNFLSSLCSLCAFA